VDETTVPGCSRSQKIQMRKINLFAIAAAMVGTGVGVWAASTTSARVAPSMDHLWE
jgi:hypothetical protein